MTCRMRKRSFAVPCWSWSAARRGSPREESPKTLLEGLSPVRPHLEARQTERIGSRRDHVLDAGDGRTVAEFSDDVDRAIVVISEWVCEAIHHPSDSDLKELFILRYLASDHVFRLAGQR